MEADLEAKQPSRHPNLTPLRKLYLVVAVIGLVSGLFGGALAWGLINETQPASPGSEQAIVEESQAVIETVERVSPSVVTVTTSREARNFFGTSETVQATAGTGIIVTSNGLILTNKHVIPESADTILVITDDGEEYEGEVLARDPLNDLAYIQITAAGLVAAKLGDSDAVQVGQKVIAIGNALGQFSNSVTSGIISGLGRPVLARGGGEAIALEDMFQTDAAINPGNSGGPLVNINGEVIGVNTAVAVAENIGFAIPINQAKAGLASIIEDGQFEKAYLGVRYKTITRELARERELPVSHGALVGVEGAGSGVLPESPAAAAGVEDGDIILAVNDQAVDQRRGLATLIARHRVGETVTLKILRGESELELEATLAALDAPF